MWLGDVPWAVQPTKDPSAAPTQLLGRPHRPGVTPSCPAALRRGSRLPRCVCQACTSLEQEAWGLREAHTECATGPQLLTQNRVLLIRRSEVNETGQDTAARASSLSPAGPMRQPGAHLLFQTQALLW